MRLKADLKSAALMPNLLEDKLAPGILINGKLASRVFGIPFSGTAL
jgi:hypothetical protein